ncbi:MAG: thioredoxin [bacterium]
MALAVTDQNFQKEVIDFPGIVIIDFWAEWCSPCTALAPIIESLAEDYSQNKNIKILKLDVDQNPETQAQYQIFSIPTIKIFKNGEVAKTIVGLHSAEDIKKNITSLLE